MLVKACGLRSLEEIRWAQELGYDFIGIMLDPQSKRYVPEPEKLWRDISPEWRKRSVLVARKWHDLDSGAQQFPEALLQCYDGYPSAIAPERRFEPVISEEQYERSAATYCLYDVSLGSGEWKGIAPWCRNHRSSRGKKNLFVAGGLNLQTLQILKNSMPTPTSIHDEKPSFGGFDLSSGLEQEVPEGQASKKDFAKMQACIEWIRANF